MRKDLTLRLLFLRSSSTRPLLLERRRGDFVSNKPWLLLSSVSLLLSKGEGIKG